MNMAAPFAAWRRERRVIFKRWWTVALVFAWGAPGALWVLALLVSYGVASHSCYPAATPVTHWLWSAAPGALKLFNIVCFVISLAALAAAGFDWSRARRPEDVTLSGARDPRSTVERVLAYASTVAALVLGFALLVNAIEIWLISRCGPA
jgi:hypothetical protein